MKNVMSWKTGRAGVCSSRVCLKNRVAVFYILESVFFYFHPQWRDMSFVSLSLTLSPTHLENILSWKWPF